ncbi:MAG: YoaK family protein [Candidatus Eiseniibacteriota bacterium]
MDDNGTRGSAVPTLALALLSFAAGSMDTLAFLALGTIFTSAMSGNTIIFGIAVGDGHVLVAAKSGTAIGGYVLGVAGATLMLSMPARRVSRVLIVESLLIAAFALLWTGTEGPSSPPALYALINLSALAMGCQGAVGRHLKLPGVVTIVFTSTLTAIVGGTVEQLVARRRPLITAPTRQQMATYAAYLASAVVIAVTAAHWPAGLPFVPLAVVVGATAQFALPGMRAT